ncbi:uncharacterized protein PSANT_00074 [Moesziomyces antarcticus]|uniref:Uncharacterized protein n=1 Tax=Pseudozyma antarctica TaxID=84753 RepID=A0A5C3FFU6_PSEA2|nr:uncharacterized protein PSANT_00074 [Moesziomyces antarcticus]
MALVGGTVGTVGSEELQVVHLAALHGRAPDFTRLICCKTAKLEEDAPLHPVHEHTHPALSLPGCLTEDRHRQDFGEKQQPSSALVELPSAQSAARRRSATRSFRASKKALRPGFELFCQN